MYVMTIATSFTKKQGISAKEFYRFLSYSIKMLKDNRSFVINAHLINFDM